MYFGNYRIPKDWWDVATVNSNSKDIGKGAVHDSGTSFRIERLDKMYKQEYDRTLLNCNVKVTEDKYGIYYKRNSLK